MRTYGNLNSAVSGALIYPYAYLVVGGHTTPVKGMGVVYKSLVNTCGGGKPNKKTSPNASS